jgi:Xaa-Pro aminopeptidase
MFANRNRIAKIISGLTAPAYLVTNAPDLLYLTGTGLEGFHLLLTPQGGVIFTSPMLKEQLQSLVPGVRVMAGNNLLNLLVRFCRVNRIGAVAVNPSKISYAFAQKIAARLKIEKAGDIIGLARSIKDEWELASIRHACRIAARVVEDVRLLLRPGVSEDDIAFKIEEYFARNNVRSSFTPIVASGPNSSKPHHLSSARRLLPDDVVMIDLGCVYNGYCSDLTRTYFLGKINRLSNKVFSLVERAKIRATAAIRPGVRASAIDAAARRVITAGGYGDEFIHSTGHGVGIEVHEAPRIRAKETTTLKPGMVITVEPGIYLSSRFGVRLEDTVLVTEKGSEVLTV